MTASFAIVLCVGMGCGKSSDTAPSTHSAGKGEGGSPGAAAGNGSSQALSDETAGNACKTDGDCANGMCLTSIAGAFGGASMEAPGGYCSAGCTTDAECGEGGVCARAFPSFAGAPATPGHCMKGCGTAEECRDGYRCVNALGMAPSGNPMDPTAALLGPAACQPTPPTTQLSDGVTGKPCQNDKECGKCRCSKTEGMMTFPMGYCSGDCLKDADCGAGGTCTLPTLGSGAGSCYSSCQTHGDSDCREGYRCRTNGSRRQCLPGPAPLGAGVVGRECTADADCGGAPMSCVTTLGGATAPRGYCSISCSDNSDCGAEGTCVGGLGSAFASLLGTTGTCYRVCVDSSMCRSGYVCGQTSSAAGGLGGMMIPGLGGMMMASSTVCTVAPAAGEDAGVP
jgi:hypothetical protein